MASRIELGGGAWLDYLPAWIAPELGLDPVVATLSFGATRKFVLKRRSTRLAPNRSLDVEHGSLLVMGGTCQRHYVHGVPRQSAVSGERISLTFRHLLRPP